MNPLTLVKRIQKISSREASLGVSDEASWHTKYKDLAYVFVGGIPFQLTEGDRLAVFAQYGEIVDVNLVRDKATGKSKGFAFLAYEDQRSTTLAVDNLNGANVLGQIVWVNHVADYKKKREEEGDEEERMQKQEARGLCYVFQKGECNRGDSCRFSHDEQRNANTGVQDVHARWEHDRSGGSLNSGKQSVDASLRRSQEHKSERRETKYKPFDKEDGRSSRERIEEAYKPYRTHKSKDQAHEKLPEIPGRERHREERNVQPSDRPSRRHYDQREPHPKDDRERGGNEKRSLRPSDGLSSRHHQIEGSEVHERGSSYLRRHREENRGHDRSP